MTRRTRRTSLLRFLPLEDRLAPAVVDLTFGGGTGQSSTNFNNRGDTAEAVALQSDGRIVHGGDG